VPASRGSASPRASVLMTTTPARGRRHGRGQPLVADEQRVRLVRRRSRDDDVAAAAAAGASFAREMPASSAARASPGRGRSRARDSRRAPDSPPSATPSRRGRSSRRERVAALTSRAADRNAASAPAALPVALRGQMPAAWDRAAADVRGEQLHRLEREGRLDTRRPPSASTGIASFSASTRACARRSSKKVGSTEPQPAGRE